MAATPVVGGVGGGDRTRLVDRGPIAWRRRHGGSRIGPTNWSVIRRGGMCVRGGGTPIVFRGRWR